MINEIKRRLENGEEVYIELVDPNGLRDRGDFQEYLIQDLLDSDKLQVLDVDLGVHSNLVKLRPHSSWRAILIDEENLVFFDLVSESATFDDLVDVAVQAVKDGVIFSTEIFEDAIYICLDRSEYDTRNPSIGVVDGLEVDMKAIPDIISKINALYTETFVIEDEDDIRKIMRGAFINLQNGNELVAESGCKRHYVNYIQTTYGNMNFNLGFVSLRGAIVTQKKTNN